MLSRDFDADFWKILLPQFGHDEPVLQHAMIALAFFHEQYNLRQESPSRFKGMALTRLKRLELSNTIFVQSSYTDQIGQKIYPIDLESSNTTNQLANCAKG
jgi:hypothetical protein